MNNKQYEEKLVKECKEFLHDNNDTEKLISHLRNRTSRKSVSIKIISLCLRIPINEATLLVNQSETWKDKKEIDKKIEEVFLQSLNNLAEEED